LIKNSGEFAINFVPGDMAHIIQAVGVTSGADLDKFQEWDIQYTSGQKVKAPILKDAYVAYECKVIDIRKYGDHDWIVGSMELFYKDIERFQENGLPDWDKLTIPLYLGRSQYMMANHQSAVQTLEVNKK
jgi:flavin reductase (DIM6/NTAB) family NADH-FMN oxidoreductase RutF